MTGTIKIVIADDNELYRDGLKLMFSNASDIKLLGQAVDGNNLIKMVSELQPDVVLTDIKMPIIDGIEATRIIVKNNPAIKVICLSMYAEDDLIISTIDAGASSYLLKNADKTEILNAIKAVVKGETYFCQEVTITLSKIKSNGSGRRGPYNKIPTLSEREKLIVVSICEGLTSKQIASKLHISFRTVEGLRTELIDKFGVKNTVGLIVAAIKHNVYIPKT